MGLTEKDAAEKLRSAGENVLADTKHASAAGIFIGQFKDVMVMILLAATGVSLLLGEISDAVTIILIVFLNAVLGFIQEFRTEHTLESLRAMTSPTARCYRDGKLKVIDAAKLVPDDVIELELGEDILNVLAKPVHVVAEVGLDVLRISKKQVEIELAHIVELVA